MNWLHQSPSVFALGVLSLSDATKPLDSQQLHMLFLPSLEIQAPLASAECPRLSGENKSSTAF